MKAIINFVRAELLFILVALLIVGVGALASDTGYRIVWVHELQSQEAQEALSDYIEKHCVADIWEYDIRQMTKQPSPQSLTPLRLHCKVIK